MKEPLRRDVETVPPPPFEEENERRNRRENIKRRLIALLGIVTGSVFLTLAIILGVGSLKAWLLCSGRTGTPVEGLVVAKEACASRQGCLLQVRLADGRTSWIEVLRQTHAGYKEGDRIALMQGPAGELAATSADSGYHGVMVIVFGLVIIPFGVAIVVWGLLRLRPKKPLRA